MIKKNSIQVRYPKISIVDVIQLSQFPSMILEASITSLPYKENRVEFHNLHNTIYANPIKVHRLFCKVISVRKIIERQISIPRIFLQTSKARSILSIKYSAVITWASYILERESKEILFHLFFSLLDIERPSQTPTNKW